MNMKKIIALLLALAMLTGVAALGISSTATDTASTEAVSADAALGAYTAKRLSAVYNTEGKMMGWLNKGTTLYPASADGKKLFVDMLGSEGSWYVKAANFEKTDAQRPEYDSPASDKVITLRQGAVLYSVDTGKRMYTVLRSPSALRFNKADDKGNYIFELCGNLVYAKKHAAVVSDAAPAESAAYAMTGRIEQLLEDNSMLVTVEEGVAADNVIVNYGNAAAPKIAFTEGLRIKIEHDGVLTASLPPQLSASRIIVLDEEDAMKNEFTGTIEQLLEDDSMLVKVEDGLAADNVIVNYGNAIAPKIAFTEGLRIKVEHDGAMTASLPPQLSASRITVLDAEENAAITGSVTDVNKNINMFTLETEEYGALDIDYSEAAMPRMTLAPGLKLSVEAAGGIVKSETVKASRITVADEANVVTGAIRSLSKTENTLVLKTSGADVTVDYTMAKMPRIALAAGQELTIEYKGELSSGKVTATKITVD